LYRAVGELLESEKKAERFLERGALPPLAKELETDAVTRAGNEGMRERARAGQQIGPYRIVAPLGAGGMGEVYRAHDGKLGRDVAIKTLPAAYVQDLVWLARFRREARTLASLNHPNIAAIYGLEESGAVDCLVLELVEGETLRGPLPVAQALDCACQIAGALEAAHSKRIIHRDLKPANLKLTPEGRVKVLDWLGQSRLGRGRRRRRFAARDGDGDPNAGGPRCRHTGVHEPRTSAWSQRR
jgi:serine/threonine protein kinase